MINILVADDEFYISNLIKISLTQAGYNCITVEDGEEALKLVEKEDFDLALLDIMMPKINGYELLEFIRAYKIPVIFITAKSSVSDKVKGLKQGAEDYITKPFDTSELLARVEVVLRRFNKNISTLIVDDIEIDLNSRTVKKNGVVISLTLKEYELLVIFLRNKNIALYRETIYERVWHENFMGDTRTVDLHVQRLRKKMHLENRIVSVYKVGYRYEELKR